MKLNFSYNLLKHLRAKKAEGGFTLIELLVVIIIIGILAAIALPSFLNQANRARETEAANGVGALNRGQQAFYLEAVEYADEMADLDVGVDANTENYAYGTVAAVDPDPDAEPGDAAFNMGADNQTALIYASPKTGIRGFAGIAYVDVLDEGEDTERNVTGAALCRETARNTKDFGVQGTPTPDGSGAGDGGEYCNDMEASS